MPIKRYLSLTITALVVGLTFIQASMLQSVSAQESPKSIILFGRDDCRHCQDLEQFLADNPALTQDIVINKYDVQNTEDSVIWHEFTAHYSLTKATPVLVIGDKIVQGFNSSETTGQVIRALLSQDYESKSVTQLLNQPADVSVKTAAACLEECEIPAAATQPYYLTLPFLGTLDITEYSLPVLTSVLGFIDGFNPCAMWVLVTFLVILLQLRDKRKMILFVGTFIVAEAVMYFLILTLWFTAWDFIGLDRIVTPVVGLIAIIAGGYFLKKAAQGDSSCPVGNVEQKQKTSSRIQQLANQKMTLVTIGGILAVAFSVNIIEFACSVGIPQTFTKVLELKGYTYLEALPYNLLYTFFYMMDDFIVFGIALLSADKLLKTQTYTKYSNLVGGIIMILLGLLLVLKPEWLMLL